MNVTTTLNVWRTSLKLSAAWLLVWATACGITPEGELDPEAVDEATVLETLVTVGPDGSVTETSRELGSEDQEAIEQAKLALGLPRESHRQESDLGALAQPLVAVSSCAATDLWLYDAAGNRLCVRWLGDSDHGLDLGKVRVGQLLCGITLTGGIPCTWANSVTAYWPGQYAGHLGTCLPRDVGLSCSMPIAFPAWGPRTNIDGSQINWVTMPS